jgi:hypothetical protein
MRRTLRRILNAVVTPGLIAVPLGFSIPGAGASTNQHARPMTSAGYGLIAGATGPCPAKTFDAPGALVLVIVLLRNGVTFSSYDVTSNQGTTSFHFDVPVGHYVIVSTYPATASYPIIVRFARTASVRVTTICPGVAKG